MKLLVFIGPSGSGKSTLVRELQCRGVIEVSPSWTTRPRRDDDDERAVEHRFVTDDEFSALEQRGFFLEVVTMFGLPYRYGLPPIEQAADGPVSAIMVRAPLIPLVARRYPDHVVYQIEAGSNEARRRVMSRGLAQSEIGDRLEGDDAERSLGRRLATRVFAGDLSLPDLVARVEGAIHEDFIVERSVRQ